jgi:hypothetical protein
MGMGNFTSSAFCSAPGSNVASLPNANSPDGQHPTNSAQAYAAKLQAAAINSVLH